MPESIYICAFDDNKSFRNALAILINETDGFEWCQGFSDCNSVLKDYHKTNADVVLMDIQMPGISGVEAVKMLKAAHPEVKILMLTNFDDDDKVFYSICYGASGYLLKNTTPEKIIEAITEVMNGGAPMTPAIAQKVLLMFRKHTSVGEANYKFDLTQREKEILECLVNGLNLKVIASSLCISYDTVRTHIKHIYEKLHVFSLTEAVSKALRENIV